MEAAISVLAAVLISESSPLKEIAPFLSCSLILRCFFFLRVIPFSLLHGLSFFLHLNFIPVSFLLETLHLFLSDTATHLSLYQHNSVECKLLAGDMKKKQYGKVQLNSQILSCICLIICFVFLLLLNW